MSQKPLSDLVPNPTNPRKITPEKLAMFSKSLIEFGNLSGIVFNRSSGHLIGGHQTVKTIPDGAQITLETTYNTPTKTGTVAEGFILVEGERYPYREVEWELNKEKAAVLAANRGAGDWDYSLVTDMLNELDAANFDLDFTMFDEAERERMMTGWDAGLESVEGTEATLDGIIATIKVKCPQALYDEVFIYLKAKLLETSFEGVEVV